VVVSTGTGRPTRRPLTDFIPEAGTRLLAVHGKMADPRSLLLDTLAQMRQQIELTVKLSAQICDIEAVERFQEEVLDAIHEASPAAGERLRELLEQRTTVPVPARAPGGGR